MLSLEERCGVFFVESIMVQLDVDVAQVKDRQNYKKINKRK